MFYLGFFIGVCSSVAPLIYILREIKKCVTFPIATRQSITSSASVPFKKNMLKRKPVVADDRSAWQKEQNEREKK